MGGVASATHNYEHTHDWANGVCIIEAGVDRREADFSLQGKVEDVVHTFFIVSVYGDEDFGDSIDNAEECEKWANSGDNKHRCFGWLTLPHGKRPDIQQYDATGSCSDWEKSLLD